MRVSVLSLLLLGVLASASARFFRQNKRGETSEDSHDPDWKMDPGFGEPINTERAQGPEPDWKMDQGFGNPSNGNGPVQLPAKDWKMDQGFGNPSNENGPIQLPAKDWEMDPGYGTDHRGPAVDPPYRHRYPPGPPGSKYPPGPPPPGTHYDPSGPIRQRHPKVGNERIGVDPVHPHPPGTRGGGRYGSPGSNPGVRKYGQRPKIMLPIEYPVVDPEYSVDRPRVDPEYEVDPPKQNGVEVLVDPGFGQPIKPVDPDYGKRPKIMLPIERYPQKNRLIDPEYSVDPPRNRIDPKYEVDPPGLVDPDFGVDRPMDPGFSPMKNNKRKNRLIDPEYSVDPPRTRIDPKYEVDPPVLVDPDFGVDRPMDPGFSPMKNKKRASRGHRTWG